MGDYDNAPYNEAYFELIEDYEDDMIDLEFSAYDSHKDNPIDDIKNQAFCDIYAFSRLSGKEPLAKKIVLAYIILCQHDIYFQYDDGDGRVRWDVLYKGEKVVMSNLNDFN